MAQIEVRPEGTQSVEVPASEVPGRAKWRYLKLFRQYPIIWVTILAVLILGAIFAPWIAPYDPIRDADFSATLRPPFFNKGGDTSHLLGTDSIGRDLFTRILFGARVSLMVAGVALVAGTVVGTVLGLTSGYMGKAVDEIIMRLVDMWIALPFLLLAMVIAIALGQSFWIMFLILTLVAWVSFVRPIRAEILSLREREYVQYARTAGASTSRILFRHMLPGVRNTVVVLATLQAGSLVLAESVLSFLGVGVPPPTPTWGGMVSDGRNYLREAWWVATTPGLAIFLLVISLNFTGDWLRDKWDPRLRQLT